MNIKFKIYFILVIIFSLPILKGNNTETLNYLKQAEEAYVQNQIKKAALNSYKALLSFSSVPNNAMIQEQRAAIIKDFTKYSIAYSKLLANEGYFQKAREWLQFILLPNVNPNNAEAYI